MNEYISKQAAVDAGYLSDWYISSVGDEPPVWTDAHIDELLNDFIVIPKDTKAARTASPPNEKYKFIRAGGLRMKDIDGYVTKDSLYRLISRIKRNPDTPVDDKTCSIIVKAISDMPKEDVEPVRYAHWVECTVRGSLALCCSDCGSDSGTLYPYDTCPNCGARMKRGR